MNGEAPDLTLGSWSFEPTSLLLIALAAGLYGGALVRQRTFEPIEWWRPLCFASGLAVIFIALSSPLDLGADEYLLSLHMVQHALLGTIAPPLLILGVTPWMARTLSQTPGVGRAMLLTHPVPAGILFVFNMWFWHIPPIYNEAVDVLAVHIVMHIAFITTGLLYWWPVIQRWPAQIRMSTGVKIAYLVLTGHPMVLLAALFFATPDALYPHYEGTRQLWGLSPLEDQQLAGLVMGALGETAGFIAFTYFFLKLWDEEQESEAAVGV